MTDAATIARRLTSAQKRALLWLPGDGSAALRLRDEPISDRTMNAGENSGIWEWVECKGWVITAHGLAVRAELERMEAGDA